jgi:hypothetical protein
MTVGASTDQLSGLLKLLAAVEVQGTLECFHVLINREVISQIQTLPARTASNRDLPARRYATVQTKLSTTTVATKTSNIDTLSCRMQSKRTDIYKIRHLCSVPTHPSRCSRLMRAETTTADPPLVTLEPLGHRTALRPPSRAKARKFECLLPAP